MRESAPVVVLGIDPGTAVTGYGIVRKEGRNPLTLVECGVIRTKPRDALPQRLAERARDLKLGLLPPQQIGRAHV